MDHIYWKNTSRLMILLLTGIIMGGITWGVSGAGGFFTVDGQSLEFGKSLSTVVGFCMASSRICCPKQGQCDKYDYPKCFDDSNFLTTQEWLVDIIDRHDY